MYHIKTKYVKKVLYLVYCKMILQRIGTGLRAPPQTLMRCNYTIKKKLPKRKLMNLCFLSNKSYRKADNRTST